MATDGGAEGGGVEREVEGLVLDEDFVRGATIIEGRFPPRPTPASGPRPIPPAREAFWSRRRRIAAATAGAVVVLGLLVAGNLSLARDHATGDTEGAAGTVGRETYVAGDCLTWPDSEGEFATRMGLEVVPCEDEHRMEMVGTVEVADGAYPTPSEWRALFDERCPSLVRAHLGHDLEPTGRLTIGGLQPTIDGWRSGDRGLACAVVVKGATANGDNVLFRGAAADG